MCVPTDTRFTMPEVEQILISAVDAHKAGNLAEAERLYRLILKTNPHHCDANHNLGVLAVAVNKPEQALQLFSAAIQTRPTVEQFWQSYIDALIRLSRTQDALTAVDNARVHGFSEEILEKWLRTVKLAKADPRSSEISNCSNVCGST